MNVDLIEALRPLFDILSDGICIADKEGRLLYANLALGRLLGRTATECESHSICSLLCGHLDCHEQTTAADCPLRVAAGSQESITFQGKYHVPTLSTPSDPSSANRGKQELRVRCLRGRTHQGERHFILVEDITPKDDSATAHSKDSRKR